MYLVNRSALVLQPTEAFLNWLNTKEEDSEQAILLTLAQIRSNCTVLLIPEFDIPEEAIAYISEHYLDIFKSELTSWYSDEKDWPDDLSLSSFWQFFEVQVNDTVLDIIEDEIQNYPLSFDKK